jgi:3-deoxy-manno-octulosonate cytidylyltransferase (CMP-KDO synthetase)
MQLPQNPIVLIPSRLAATRLPNKPLADIHGQPMIVHVWRRAVEAGLGPVVVAAGDQPIVDAILAAGGKALLTSPAHPSGSDRIFEVLERVDPERRHDAVLNVQGDLPTVDPQTVRAAFTALGEAAADIGTAAAVARPEEHADPAVVKPVVAFAKARRMGDWPIARALYFSRATVPTGPGPVYHHIGLYAYRRPALERFVKLAPGELESRERLEQLRALEAGMQIWVALVDTVPLGVDTPADLERARAHLAPKSTPQPRP